MRFRVVNSGITEVTLGHCLSVYTSVPFSPSVLHVQYAQSPSTDAAGLSVTFKADVIPGTDTVSFVETVELLDVEAVTFASRIATRLDREANSWARPEYEKACDGGWRLWRKLASTRLNMAQPSIRYTIGNRLLVNEKI